MSDLPDLSGRELDETSLSETVPRRLRLRLADLGQ
jgi:hypothetical protein